jgi:hypothetical protein
MSYGGDVRYAPGTPTAAAFSGSNTPIVVDSTAGTMWVLKTGDVVAQIGAGAGGVTDGDKGDITVTGGGLIWTIDNGVVTYAKMQNVTDARLLGRSAGSAGSPMEITVGSGLSLSAGTLTATGSPAASASQQVVLFLEDGQDGEIGIPGREGAAGAAGSTGAPGATGPAGPAIFLLDEAFDGDAGPPGPTGATGATGSIGPAGPAGPSGPYIVPDDGMDGDIGPPGIQGVAGAAGSAGATGAQGPAGPAIFLLDEAMDGDMGPPGMTGPQGPAGSSGAGGAFNAFTKDLGANKRSGTFDITGLSGLTANKVVSIVQTMDQISSKGNARDEYEMDPITLTGYVVDAATIRALWACGGGQSVAVGTYAFAYQVSG